VSDGAIVGIAHVQVAAPAGCEPQARAFYGDALGLPELAKPDALAARGGCWFACGDRQLHVGVAEPFAPATKAHPALRVRDAAALAALLDRLAARGFPVRRDSDLPGIVRAFTDDPFGNRIELVAPAPPTHA
jgi:catechol 2,3-dioxygenase-like lactoylglutathione lyase family enzyme